jgi:hypothetical protein
MVNFAKIILWKLSQKISQKFGNFLTMKFPNKMADFFRQYYNLKALRKFPWTYFDKIWKLT